MSTDNDEDDSQSVIIESDEELYSEQSDSEDLYDEENSSIPFHDYVSEAKQIIFSYDEITVSNATKLIAEYQKMLELFKTNLESLVKNCNDKYKRNEVLLSENNTKGVRGNIVSYYQCGAPFFKTRKLFTAPINPEYLFRRYKQKEYFPLDAYEVQSCYWTSLDKVILLQSVKKQILAILDIKNNAYEKTIKDLYNLFKKSKLNSIDWHMISVKDLQSRHSSYSCMAVWNGYLKPDIKRGTWTEAEEKILVKTVDEHNGQNWESISNQLSGRSDFQCFVHYTASLSKQCIHDKWTANEDKLLLEIVERYRIGSFIPWNKVTLYIPNRNKTQVYYRYVYSVDPSIKKGKFTEEEDCTIIAGVQEYGLDFKKWPIDFIPARTLIQIKKRYNNVLQYVGKYESWSHVKDKELMKLVDIYGDNNFSKISSVLKNFNSSRCRNRFKYIKKYLLKNPGTELKDVPRKNKPITSSISKNNWLEKIIDIKENKNNEENNKIMLLCDKIPTIYRKYINYFKYNYYYKHGKHMDIENTRTIYIINKLLDGKFFYNNNIDYNYNINMKNALQTCCNLKFNGNFHKELNNFKNNFIHILPNWNTIVSLRSLTIMYSNEIKSIETNCNTKSMIKNDINTENEFCLNLFKKRFQSIFYWTIILSKIDETLLLKLKNGYKRLSDEPIKYNVICLNGLYELEHNSKSQINNKTPGNSITEQIINTPPSISIDIDSSSSDTEPQSVDKLNNLSKQHSKEKTSVNRSTVNTYTRASKRKTITLINLKNKRMK